MKEEIRFVGGTVRDFEPQWLFNVKFKFSEADLNYSNKPILTANSIPSHRYILMDKNKTLSLRIMMRELSRFSIPIVL